MSVAKPTWLTSAIIAPAVLVTVAALAGCGSAKAQNAGTPLSGAHPSAASQGCPSQRITITTADNNKALCVTTGAIVTVLLRGTQSDRWTFISTSTSVLVPRPDPRMTLMVGVTGESFTAIRPGVAVITSARPPRQLSGTAITSAPTRCGPPSAFRVVVTVRPR